MKGSLKLSELVDFLRKEGFIDSMDIGEDLVIEGFSPIQNTAPATISWMKSASAEINWSQIEASVVICPENLELPSVAGIVFIPVENPKLTFIKILQEFFSPERKTGIEDTAIIGKNCRIGRDVYVGHYVVIGDNVEIGDGTTIHSNVNVYDGVTIGANCTVNSGCVIGADGFGYEREGGRIEKFPQLGSVIIEDDVEIGGNTCIDRGAIADTVIRRNAKIDNLCHIAHNAEVGENTFVIACSEISGSTRIGRGCLIAPSVTTRNGIVVGDNAIVGLGAVVVKDVEPGDTVAGVPARSLKKESDSS
ncbi:MAG: UDP-3-O-(3-hydroxymyristoyl)glucosamine N-acyltransferase [Actinomycetia bacterium]|nr:UDP-3-O-(3-hydroxymyristoyl)glucosamine N-acyltransferase [Actinomycetes bacterium]